MDYHNLSKSGKFRVKSAIILSIVGGYVVCIALYEEYISIISTPSPNLIIDTANYLIIRQIHIRIGTNWSWTWPYIQWLFLTIANQEVSFFGNFNLF